MDASAILPLLILAVLVLTSRRMMLALLFVGLGVWAGYSLQPEPTASACLNQLFGKSI